MTRSAERVGKVLARLAGVEGESLTWRVTDGPWFDNQIATLDIEGRHATFRLETAVGPGDASPRLEQVGSRSLA
jgi:hypothetical protein